MEAQPVDAGALRRWAGSALVVLARSREEIDALNVFPIADSDTGTNMYLTLEAACRALDDRMAADGDALSVPEALKALAHGALVGARGNSGVILSQLLRGAALAQYTGSAVDGTALATGLRAASDLAHEAVANPAEGTILTVAEAAATAAEDAVRLPWPTYMDSLSAVASAAAEGARDALARTTEQLDVLREAGVVDAGGLGLVVILDTLAAYTGGTDPRLAFRQRRLTTTRASAGAASESASATADPESASRVGGPATPPRRIRASDPTYEVIYLLEATDEAVTGPDGLRAALFDFCEDGGGDSLVVVGGAGLWRVHIHVDDPGRPIEAGIAAGRPYEIKITHFRDGAAAGAHGIGAGRGPGAGAATPTSAATAEQKSEKATRAVIAVAYGPGLADLFEEAGARVIRCFDGRSPSAADLERAVLETRAAEVILLPNDADTAAVAAAVAERFGAEGLVRLAAVPTKVTVQGIAALAVHEPSRRFEADVVAMTAAAGATRFGAIEVAAGEAWTMAGVCRAGQVLGHVEYDVALIEDEQDAAASAVLARMLSAGGEMVTLVVGAGAADALTDTVTEYLERRHPYVDVVVYEGGQSAYPILIGVE